MHRLPDRAGFGVGRLQGQPSAHGPRQLGHHLTTFSPQDFGLSEADIADYEARQQLRQRAVNVHKQRPLNADLKRRLDAISQQGKVASPAERTQLLHELEALMNENLQALLPNPQ